LHPAEAPQQEPIIPSPPNQSSTQILPTIIEDPEHPAFRNIHEVHLHQLINPSTTAVEPSHTHSATTSSQATAGAPRQSLPWAPSSMHMLPGDAELDHVWINDWDEEAEEEEAAVEEEELARV
jgi:hypothetical protein